MKFLWLHLMLSNNLISDIIYNSPLQRRQRRCWKFFHSICMSIPWLGESCWNVRLQTLLLVWIWPVIIKAPFCHLTLLYLWNIGHHFWTVCSTRLRIHRDGSIWTIPKRVLVISTSGPYLAAICCCSQLHVFPDFLLCIENQHFPCHMLLCVFQLFLKNRVSQGSISN